MASKGIRKTCSRGHVFYKSSTCPTCPTCWPGMQKKRQSDFPKISAPALRALHNAKIRSLKDLSRRTKDEVAELHGMGPKALKILTGALKKHKLSFRL